jgi:hypothetical protein
MRMRPFFIDVLRLVMDLKKGLPDFGQFFIKRVEFFLG